MALVEGTKFDDGKVRYDLIPAYPLSQLAEVYTYGAKKYADRNWEKGIKWGRVFGAIMRHLWKFWSGQEVDPESKLPHLAHAAFGVFALLQYSVNRRDFDDRAKDEPPAQANYLAPSMRFNPDFLRGYTLKDPVPGPLDHGCGDL